MSKTSPIGFFDSGYGGLTVLKEVVSRLPAYDYIYLGDNARAPYGTRSFETVYHYTLECIKYLFQRNCPLIIVACNTASAKALRTIQQQDLPRIAPDRRVLGVIRPTTEVVGNMTQTGNIGILGTPGTILSESYPIEIKRFFPQLRVYQEACPMWVPLVENHEFNSPGADYFIRKHIDNLLALCPSIDTLVLGCTHYPLLLNKIKQCLPPGINVISQGNIVADSLENYLQRHTEIETRLSKNGEYHFLTTDSCELFDQQASLFFGKEIQSEHLDLSIESGR